MPAVFQKTVEQDLHKPLKIQYCADTVFTKDNAGNQINVLLFEDGVPYNSGGTVSATAIRADGATETLPGTISGNTVSVALTQAALDVPGTLQVFIKVTAGTVKTTVYAGVYNVVCTETPTVVAPVTPSDVAALIASIEAAIRNIPADWTSFLGTIAPTFEPDKTGGYAAGDYVWHPGQPDNVGTLYRFTSAHSGSWVETDATLVVIGNELNDTVRYTPQVHTDAEKAIARTNMGAAAAADLTALSNSVGTVPSGTTVENQIFSQGTQISTNASNIDALQRQVGTVPTGETVEGQIGDLKSTINEQTIFADTIFENGSVIYDLTYTNYAMNDTTGQQGNASTKRASTPGLYYIPIETELHVSYDSTAQTIRVYCFDEDGAYLGYANATNISNNIISLPTGTRWMRFFMQNSGGTTDITPQQAASYATYTAVYVGRVKDIENDIDDIEADIVGVGEYVDSFIGNNFEFGSFDKFSSIFTSKAGYNASSSGWVSNASYNSWYFMTDCQTKIYADSTEVSALTYFAIEIYNGAVSAANYVGRYRISDSNLPTKSSPLTVSNGQTIVVTVSSSDTNFNLFASNTPMSMSDGFIQQINDANIDPFIRKNFNYGFVTKDSNIFTSKAGYSASSAGWLENAGYNSWYFEAEADCNIYTETNDLYYYSICIFNGEVSSGNYVARYRKNESNLPTKSSPLHVLEGQTIAITTDVRDSNFILYYDQKPILLGDQMVTQVESLIQGTTVEYSTNKYVITSNGISFDLRKTVDATINQDCWRFVSVKKGSTDLVNGDIIGVLLEHGESDYMGGVHGDEKVVDFYIRADGKDITEALTVCKRVTIFMYSHLYRVSSPTTNIVDRYVNITIENGVMTVENTFKCLVDGFVVEYAYNSGLIGIFKSNITYLASNTGVANLSDMPTEWNDSHENYWYDVLFSDGILHIENIVGKEQPNYSGRVHYFSNENPQRLKVYITTDTGSTWDTGHICNGKFVYSFD